MPNTSTPPCALLDAAHAALAAYEASNRDPSLLRATTAAVAAYRTCYGLPVVYGRWLWTLTGTDEGAELIRLRRDVKARWGRGV